MPDLPPDTPVVRDPDGSVYFRENEGRFLAGGFEPKAKPAFMDSELPERRAELTEDWDHFSLLLENLLHRVPAMKTALLERLRCEMNKQSRTEDQRSVCVWDAIY